MYLVRRDMPYIVQTKMRMPRIPSIWTREVEVNSANWTRGECNRKNGRRQIEQKTLTVFEALIKFVNPEVKLDRFERANGKYLDNLQT